jgi:hypothetical protein
MHVPLATGYPVYPEYNVYRYDPSTLSWTTSGILNPAKRITGTSGDYLEVQISHFSTFATGGVPADNGGGGGCALAPWGNANPVEYGLPFVAYVLVLLGITYLDSRRRRAGADRRP